MKIIELVESSQLSYHNLDIALSRVVYLSALIKEDIDLLLEIKHGLSDEEFKEIIFDIDRDINALLQACDIIRIGLNQSHIKERKIIDNNTNSVIKKRRELNYDGLDEGDNPNYFGFGGGSASPIPGTPLDLQPQPTKRQKKIAAINAERTKRFTQRRSTD